eukprot:1161152-Prymnesium_polylepis.1
MPRSWDFAADLSDRRTHTPCATTSHALHADALTAGVWMYAIRCVTTTLQQQAHAHQPATRSGVHVKDCCRHGTPLEALWQCASDR